MRALGQIVSSTGDVVTPYLEYPELLDAVLDALKVSVSAANAAGDDGDDDEASGSYRLRIEAIRTVGILGALAPPKVRGLGKGGMRLGSPRVVMRSFLDSTSANDDQLPLAGSSAPPSTHEQLPLLRAGMLSILVQGEKAVSGYGHGGGVGVVGNDTAGVLVVDVDEVMPASDVTSRAGESLERHRVCAWSVRERANQPARVSTPRIA